MMTFTTLSCPLCCRQELDSVEALREHLLYFAYRPISCPVCQAPITGLQSLVHHLDKHLNSNCDAFSSVLFQDIAAILPESNVCSVENFNSSDLENGSTCFSKINSKVHLQIEPQISSSKCNLVQLDLITVQEELSSTRLGDSSADQSDKSQSNFVVEKSSTNSDSVYTELKTWGSKKIENASKAKDSVSYSFSSMIEKTPKCSDPLQDTSSVPLPALCTADRHNSNDGENSSSSYAEAVQKPNLPSGVLRAYTCSICGEKIVSQSLYFQHLQSHSISQFDSGCNIVSEPPTYSSQEKTFAGKLHHGQEPSSLHSESACFQSSNFQEMGHEFPRKLYSSHHHHSDYKSDLQANNGKDCEKKSVSRTLPFSTTRDSFNSSLARESDSHAKKDLGTEDLTMLYPTTGSSVYDENDSSYHYSHGSLEVSSNPTTPYELADSGKINECKSRPAYSHVQAYLTRELTKLVSSSENYNGADLDGASVNEELLPPSLHQNKGSCYQNANDVKSKQGHLFPFTEDIARLKAPECLQDRPFSSSASKNYSNQSNESYKDTKDGYFHKKFHHEHKIATEELEESCGPSDEDVYIPAKQSVWVSRLNDSITQECPDKPFAVLKEAIPQSRSFDDHNATPKSCDATSEHEWPTNVDPSPGEGYSEEKIPSVGDYSLDGTDSDTTDLNETNFPLDCTESKLVSVATDVSGKEPKERSSEQTVAPPDQNKGNDARQNDTDRKCSICFKSFFSISNYKRHIREKHSVERSFVCKECKKKFNTYRSLVNHMGVHRLTKSFQCNLCDHRCFTSAGIRTHKHEVHKMVTNAQKSYKCSDCGEVFLKKFNFERHRKRKHNSSAYACQFCGKSFSYFDNLQNHIKSHDGAGSPSFRCNVCDCTFKSRYSLKRHKNVRHEAPLPVVKSNNHNINNNNNINNNRSEEKSVEGNSKLSCQVRAPCQFHMDRLNCDIENRTGNSVSSSSLILVTSEKPNLNNFSNVNQRASEFSLKNVSEEVTQAFDAVPSTSDKLTFVGGIQNVDVNSTLELSRGELSRGELSRGDLSRGEVSSGELSRGNLFRGELSRGELSIGEISRGEDNSGEIVSRQRHVCNVCHKDFSRKDSLIAHLRLHSSSQSKQFACNSCDKKFARKSSLETHMDKHSLVPSYSCDLCSKQFKFKVSLKHHSCQQPSS